MESKKYFEDILQRRRCKDLMPDGRTGMCREGGRGEFGSGLLVGLKHQTQKEQKKDQLWAEGRQFWKNLVLESHEDIQTEMPSRHRRFRSVGQEQDKAANVTGQKTFHIHIWIQLSP